MRPLPRTRAELLSALTRRLKEAGIAAPEAEARALAQAALGESPETFFARLGEPVPREAYPRIEAWLARRLLGEPLGLILGTVEFFGLSLRVRPGVFLPRPETEGLVALALKLLSEKPALRVLDVGTGSGAIALALKYARPDAQVFASDPNPKALALARENAGRLGLAIALIPGSFPPSLRALDLVVANPPYLPERYRKEAPPELAYEPEEALYAGKDGLDVARPLAQKALGALRPGGGLLFELDPSNAGLLARELVRLGYRGVCTLPDLAGRPRYLLAYAPAPKPPRKLGLA